MTFFIDNLEEIFTTLKTNRLRTFLTGFSVAWGIFMLVLLLAGGTGIENGVKNEFRSVASNSIWVRQGLTSKPYLGMQPGRQVEFKQADYDRVKRSFKDIEHITARYYLWNSNQITYGKEYGAFNIIAHHADHSILEKTILVAGRLINQLDVVQTRKVVTIGTQAAEQLFKAESPVGKTIIVNGVAFKVIGVHADDGWEGHLRLLYMPITTAQEVFGGRNRVDAFMFTIGNATIEQGQAMERSVRHLMAESHKFDPDDPKALRISNTVEQYQKLMNLFSGVRIFIWLIGLGTIVAGIVGVSNIMMIAVKERTRELGVRKALGATPLSIVNLIMTESILITSVAGYLGLVAAVALVELADRYLPKLALFQHPQIDFRIAVSALVVLVAAGTMAGLIPARRAAAIMPVEALRDE
jgi:putative ABC transport system permease protein